MWMATKDQLKVLDSKCYYLQFEAESPLGLVEEHSGGLQMFSKSCGFEKVHLYSRLYAVACQYFLLQYPTALATLAVAVCVRQLVCITSAEAQLPCHTFSKSHAIE